MSVDMAKDINPVNLIGLLGGTFDPIHNGHMRLSLECYYRVGLSEVMLIPCGHPVHRSEPEVNAQQRFEMANLAISCLDDPRFSVNGLEIERMGVSYTIDTLTDLVANKPFNCHYCLILGADAIQSFPTWRDWQKILELCHIIVVQRSGYPIDGVNPPLDWMKDHLVSSRQALKDLTAGAIYIVEMPLIDLSATYIRSLLHNQMSPQFLVPDAVYQYIKDQQLYQGDRHKSSSRP